MSDIRSGDLMRTLIGVVILYGVLQVSANELGSLRGEWGLAVALLVLAAAFLVQRFLHGESWRALGLGAPRAGGILAALAMSGALAGAALGYALFTGVEVAPLPGAPLLLIGIFLQGGVAEEVVFRGYLFGRIRRTRPFWRAAMISIIPFALVHMTLFLSMDWPIALTALIMSIVLCFPLARLYELGGQTIWAPALLHAAIQAPKAANFDDALFPILWMIAGMIIAWCVFLIPAPRQAVSAAA